MESAATPLRISAATRVASVFVFPEPAPAITRSGPVSCCTAARWWGLSVAKKSNGFRFAGSIIFVAASFQLAGPCAAIWENMPAQILESPILTEAKAGWDQIYRLNYHW